MHRTVDAIIALAAQHQSIAYGLVLLLAASEAVPVVGLFIPATALIVGLSALVPSGALGLWPLMIGASVGAILGDGGSYWLGHRYHRELTGRWPLNRYPDLLARGEAFFERHGAASVFIARFTPGVRSIVPLIAGILRMPRVRFYAMNVLSAVLWAPSHILAGALIGASLELLGAVAGRLAILLLLVAAVLWVAAWTVRRAWRAWSLLATRVPEQLSAWAGSHDSWLCRRIRWLLDPGHKELPTLAILAGSLAGSIWAAFAILRNVMSGGPLARADTAVFEALQSLRTTWGDQVMVALSELGDATVTSAVAAIAFVWFAGRGAWRTAAYWLSAVGCAALFALVVKVTLGQPMPAGGDYFSEILLTPSSHAAVSVVVYGFLTVLIVRESPARSQLWGAAFPAVLIALIALSRVYLGVHWLSDALAGLAFGIAWTALMGMGYLRRNPSPINAGGLCVLVGGVLLLVGGIHVDRTHATDMARYAVHEERRTMTVADWWRDGWLELPARRFDLGGELEEPLTLQYAGDLDAMRQTLLSTGWRRPEPWSLRYSLAWLTPAVTPEQLPVLPRLQNGGREELVLVHGDAAGDPRARLVLHLWRSRVDLSTDKDGTAPLWIGMIARERITSLLGLVTLAREEGSADAPRDTLAQSFPAGRLVRRGRVVPGAAWDGAVLLVPEPALAPAGP